MATAPLTPPAGAQLVIENLWISGVDAVSNQPNLDQLFQAGIRLILTVASEAQLTRDRRFQYVRVDILDDPSEALYPLLDPLVILINIYRERGEGVLVHCMQGISRSSAVVCAYLISRFQVSLQEAYDYLVKKRQGILPNAGFQVRFS